MQGFRSQAGLAVSQQNLQFPVAPEDDTKLRKTIDAIGGITRTLPSTYPSFSTLDNLAIDMERSLFDNELRNIEKNYRFHNQLDNTSNKRLNTLLHKSIIPLYTSILTIFYSPMNQVYSPYFDAPNAREMSPQRGDIPNLQKPGLYFSPEKNLTTGQQGQPLPQFPPQLSGI